MKAIIRGKEVVLLMGLLLNLWGCATTEPERSQRQPSVEAPPKPPGMEELLVTQLDGDQKLEERLLSFSVKGADIKEVLQGLAQASELNIVFDPDVSGTVTVDLKDVTLAHALEIILTPLGLEFRREKNVIRVAKPRLETRIFTVDYVNIKRGGRSNVDVTVSAAQGGGGLGISGGTASTPGSGIAGGSTSVQTEQEAGEFFKDLEESLKKLLSKQGTLAVNKLSGTVAVTDFPANLRAVAAFLEKVTGIIMRQVAINARVMEVILDESFQFGIDWTAVVEVLGENLTISQVLAPGAGAFNIAVTGSDFSTVVNAIATQGEVNILSNPKVSAMNNQKAIIRVARDDVFFQNRVRTLLQAGETIERVTETVPTVVNIGVTLDVTPQIRSDGRVTMHIHPIVTDKLGDATDPISGQTAPIVAIREADTLVTVDDGETIIIGGLIEERQDDEVIKVPLLGDIPLLGGLFRRTQKESRKSELVILLSPTVLVGDRAQKATAEALERVEELKEGIPFWPLVPRRSP